MDVTTYELHTSAPLSIRNLAICEGSISSVGLGKLMVAGGLHPLGTWKQRNVFR